MLTFTKKVRIRALWNAHCKHMDEVKATVWRLLSHPQATPEQLAQVRVAAVVLEQRNREIKALLREHGVDV